MTFQHQNTPLRRTHSLTTKSRLRRKMSDEPRAKKARESYAERKNLKCPYCHDKFTCDFNLNQHVRAQHTHEKPYVCRLCFPNRGYTRRWLLNRHMKDLHPGEGQEAVTPSNLVDVGDEGFDSQTLPTNPALVFNTFNEPSRVVHIIPGLNEDDQSTWTMLAPPPSSSSQTVLYFPCTECSNTFTTESDLHFHCEYYHPYVPSVSTIKEEPWLAISPDDGDPNFNPEQVSQDYIARCPRD